MDVCGQALQRVVTVYCFHTTLASVSRKLTIVSVRVLATTISKLSLEGDGQKQM